MSSFLAKRIISSYFFFSSPHHLHHHLPLLNPLIRQALSTQPQKLKDFPFIAHYLISSLDFSPERALKVSTDKKVAALKSEDWPKLVVEFLKHTGLSDSEIKAVVSLYPPLLASNVEKTLKQKVNELMDAGICGELLVLLIRYNPPALVLKGTLQRLLFWRDFVGNNDPLLLRVIRHNSLLITYDIEKHVVPGINLLTEYGLSKQDIVNLISRKHNRFMARSVDFLRQRIDIVEELGLRRGSGMFLCGLRVACRYSKTKIKGRLKFFEETYGWSQEKVCSAFVKFPNVLACSEENVKLKMNFLINKAGFEARSIALRPCLLGYSLEKVLIPRHAVLSALKANELKKKISLSTASTMSERCFFERYVVPYEKDVPGLREVYAAAHSGVVTV